MKTCAEIRHANLLRLIREAGGEDALATRYGCEASYIKQMARQYKASDTGKEKGMGSATARKFEVLSEKERGWMDHEHDDPDPIGNIRQFRDRDIAAVAAMMEATDARGRIMALAAVKIALAGYRPDAAGNTAA